ncbi:hypothetical protein DOY81_001712 [Sarcophaga bullata]|nr:hypothetical protein DOY81_001712 [Sarcophaga bullata]
MKTCAFLHTVLLLFVSQSEKEKKNKEELKIPNRVIGKSLDMEITINK